MLKLKNITKNYETASTAVPALKGISIEFRKSEFVSILGQSGCGKTTLLNIIGGLDRYTDGDLIINGKSTKEFKDKDWDAYRNYSVGFVFQNYNLIPHQTVLSNVELALTLSGVTRKERREKAIKALQDVGLGYIKLGQSSTTLSGGEAQRVKLATELSKRATGKTLYILDEPTTGFHSYDLHKLCSVLFRLQKAGNTVLIIEHNLDVIKLADYIVDLGPEGGSGGGTIVATGSPEQVALIPESHTGKFLKKIL